MASAVPAFPLSKKTTNFACLTRLLVDVGAQALRNTFDSICLPEGLHAYLATTPIHATLQSLRKKRILNPTQWIKLYPATSSSVSSEHFDATLLMVLLRNICCLTPPLTGWDNLPPAADTTVEADIARVRYCRNSVYGHASQASVDDTTFNNYWMDIRDPLVRLGGASYGPAIDKLKNECMDPDIEEHYIELLKQWKKDDDSIKDKLDEIAPKISKIEVQAQDLPTKPLDLNQCQDQLRSLYNTMSQVKITPWDKDNTVHIDEVYTQLSWRRDVKKPSGTTQEKVNDYSEIFEGHKNYPNPKRILVYGRPGIGKSTFVQKIAVDWASGEKEILKKFDILLMIKLRDVCDLEDFRGVLKAAELLSTDGLTSVDSLYEYVRQNQEKVLLVFDGYDEYHCSADKLSPVLEMWKGSQLRDCSVVLTTRQDNADELKKFAHVQSEIRGFDTMDQVKEFARKFLVSYPAVDTFADYLSKQKLGDLGQIPLVLLTLCVLWKKRGIEGMPQSRFDLFKRFTQTLLCHMQQKDPRDRFQSIDKCKDELTKVGKLAFDALLNGSLHFKLSDLPSDIPSEKFIRAGLFQISKLSSTDPQEEVVFVHKSFQEFLAAWFVVHELELDFAAIDSLRKFEALEEVLKFVCGWSEEASNVVLSHLGLVGRKVGLTEYKFADAPSLDDFTEDQVKFFGVVLDCFVSSPASGKPELYSLLLASVGGVLIIKEHHLSVLAEKNALKSTSLPNYVFFSGYMYKDKRSYALISIVMDDLNALVVGCEGEMEASGFLKRYNVDAWLFSRSFFLKKEGEKVCLYFIYLVLSASREKDIHLLRELATSSPENTSTQGTIRHHCFKLLSTFRSHLVPNGTFYNIAEFVPAAVKSLCHTSNLSHLDLSLYPLCGSVRSLAKNLRHVPHLSSLMLEIVRMGDQECASLAMSLKFVPRLKVLSLIGNPLRHGVTNLAKHLKSVPLLTELRLEDTHMGEEEAGALALALKYLPQLEELDLSSNPLGCGVSVVARHLSSVSKLKILNLSDTKMGENEAGALARALKDHVPQLEDLCVDSNQVGRGMSVFIQHLSYVPKIAVVGLAGVRMTKKEVDELTTMLRCLVHVSCVGSDYHDEGGVRYSEEELREEGTEYDVE